MMNPWRLSLAQWEQSLIGSTPNPKELFGFRIGFFGASELLVRRTTFTS
jgi:hypothetical protein